MKRKGGDGVEKIVLGGEKGHLIGMAPCLACYIYFGVLFSDGQHRQSENGRNVLGVPSMGKIYFIIELTNCTFSRHY